MPWKDTGRWLALGLVSLAALVTPEIAIARSLQSQTRPEPPVVVATAVIEEEVTLQPAGLPGRSSYVAVVLENPNEAVTLIDAVVTIRMFDFDDALVRTTSETIRILYPRERLAYADLSLPFSDAPWIARIEASTRLGTWEATSPSDTRPFVATVSDLRTAYVFPSGTAMYNVTATVSSALPTSFRDTFVVAIASNEAGDIIGIGLSTGIGVTPSGDSEISFAMVSREEPVFVDLSVNLRRYADLPGR